MTQGWQDERRLTTTKNNHNSALVSHSGLRQQSKTWLCCEAFVIIRYDSWRMIRREQNFKPSHYLEMTSSFSHHSSSKRNLHNSLSFSAPLHVHSLVIARSALRVKLAPLLLLQERVYVMQSWLVDKKRQCKIKFFSPRKHSCIKFCDESLCFYSRYAGVFPIVPAVDLCLCVFFSSPTSSRILRVWSDVLLDMSTLLSLSLTTTTFRSKILT